MEIQWTETDPETGGKLYYRAERFAGKWTFRLREHRRGESKRVHPTRAMWDIVLDALERRYRRREGVSDADVAQVKTIMAEMREPPAVGDG
jgi:hypothetical protein